MSALRAEPSPEPVTQARASQRCTIRERCEKTLASAKRISRRVSQGARRLVKGTGPALVKAGRWAKKHPYKAAALGLGAVAMVGSVVCLAPAVSGGVATCLTPVLGKTAATIAGTAAGGAVASGSRSLFVYSMPMIAGVDPFNPKQLSVDVSMSTGFGFFGFAQAAGLKSLTTLTGLDGLALFAANLTGLVGYELAKDYAQNRIRARVANDPKEFRQIWRKSLLMEVASNLHRCIPGLNLETSYGAKITGDIAGAIWWDRIINKRNTRKDDRSPERDALGE